MTKSQESNNQFDVDAILSELGGFGKFQIWNFVLISLSVIISAVTSLTYVFTTGNLNYRCKIPYCESEPAEYNPNWLIHAVPFENGVPEKCFRFPDNFTNTTQCFDVDSFNATVKIGCDEFVYETEEVTMINEFNLTCDENEWKLAFVGTINGIALLVAIPILGILSDRYGRRTLFVLGLFFSSIFGLLKSFSNSYMAYITWEFCEAAVGAGAYATSFILAMELLEPKMRVFGGTLIACSYTIGEILLGGIAMNVNSFRTLLLISYAPLLLVISYFWLIPESVRWLAIKRKRQEAIKVILQAADTNKIQLSEKVLDMIKNSTSNCSKVATISTIEPIGSIEPIGPIEPKTEDTVVKESFLDVMRSKILLIRLFNCSFCWIVIALVYYGLSLNSVNLAGSKYINFMLVCAAEIPGYFITIMVMEKAGRKWSLCVSLVVCGLSCLGSEYLPADEPYISLAFFLTGKSAISVSFTILYVYTAELYPTNLRSSAMCLCSMIGRVGSIAAPQTPFLAHYYSSLPLLLFGSLSIISGLLVLRLPETLNTNLPDTIEEAEQLNKTNKDKDKV